MIIPVVNKRINGVIRPLGVTEENRAEVICFNVAFPGCEEFVWYLVYRKNDGTGSTVPLETDVHDGAVMLAWNPTREVTSLAGSITVMLKGITEDGRVWESIPSSMTVVEGIDPDEGETEEPSVLDHYLIKFQALYNKTLKDASEIIDEEAVAKIEEITEAKATALSAIDTESSEAVGAISRLANLALDRIDEQKSAAIGAIEEVKDDYVKIVDDYAQEKTVEIEAAADAVKKAAIQEITVHEENLKEDLDNHTSSKKSEITDFTEAKKAELQETSNSEKRGVSEEGTRQKDILNKAASDGINAINNTRDGVITSVQEKGSEQIGAVQSAGDEEVSRVQGVYQADLSKKADKSTTYTKTEVDTLVDGAKPKDYDQLKGRVTELENENVALKAWQREQDYRLDNAEALSDHLDYHEETVGGLLEYPKLVQTAKWAEVEEVYGKCEQTVVEGKEHTATEVEAYSFPTEKGEDGHVVTDVDGLKVYGRSLKWNQLVTYGAFLNRDSNGISLVNNGDGSITINGTATARTELYAFGNIDSIKQIPVGHKVFVAIAPQNKINVVCYTASYGSTGIYTAKDSIQTVNASIGFLKLDASSGTTFTNEKITLKMSDLTAMFGSGNEPTSVSDPRIAEIKAYAELHPEYDGGSVVSAEPNVKVGGRNLLDESSFSKLGVGVVGSDITLKLKPNTQYTLSTTTPINDGSASIFCRNSADSSSTSVNGVWVNHPITATTLSDGIIVIQYRNIGGAEPYGNKTMLEEGTEAHAYEPYTAPSTYQLPVLRGIGDVRDYYDRENKRVVRMCKEENGEVVALSEPVYEPIDIPMAELPFPTTVLELDSDLPTTMDIKAVTPSAPSPMRPAEVRVVEEVDVKGVGKNLFDKSKVTASSCIRSADGVVWTATALSGWVASDFIPVEASTAYYQNTNGVGSSAYGVAFYDASKNYLSGRPFTGSTVVGKIDVPSGASYMRTSISASSIDTAYVVRGSVATSYTPYRSSSITKSIVLRGIGSVRDTYNPRTGKVTRRIGYNVADETFKRISLQSINNFGISNFVLNGFSEEKPYNGANAKGNVICNLFKPQESLISETTVEGFYMNKENTTYIRISSESASSVAEFRDWLKTHNIYIAWALKEPYEEDVGIIEPWIVSEQGGSVTVTSTEAQAEALINYETVKEVVA